MSATIDRDEHDAIVAEKNRLIQEGLEIVDAQRAEINRLRSELADVKEAYDNATDGFTEEMEQ